MVTGLRYYLYYRKTFIDKMHNEEDWLDENKLK